MDGLIFAFFQILLFSLLGKLLQTCSFMCFSLFRILSLFMLFMTHSFMGYSQIDTFDLSLYQKPDLERISWT